MFGHELGGLELGGAVERDDLVERPFGVPSALARLPPMIT
jgi:hypothetical protein